MQTICENINENNEVIRIGRHPDNTIVFDSPNVSGFHAEITFDGEQLYINDLNSTNGCFVNGNRIHSSRILKEDEVTIGKSIQLDLDQLYEMLLFDDRSSEQNSFIVERSRQEESDFISSDQNLLIEELPRQEKPEIIVDHSESQSNQIELDSNDQSFELSAQEISEVDYPEIEDDLDASGTVPFIPEESEIIIMSERIELDKETVSIGRDDSNDIVLNYTQVSRHHAIVKETDEGYMIHDLQSSNGTFVNGKRIDSCLLQDYDQIQLGAIKLVVKSGGFEKFDQSKGVRLDVVEAMQQNQEKIFLHKTSLSIYPNEFVGLLAPAGAGKSTLVETIIGIRKPTSGQVFINGTDFHENFDSFRQWIGYVPQDDIIHKELTVRQCLYFAAKLRLALDDNEINERIDEILEDLELTHVQDTQIGGNNERVSGGQRKRVNLGVELLAEPGLLFFDEPTTGLDPRTERMMMKLFRKLADEGRTIIVITHCMESLDLLDNIIFLSAGGTLSYYGPAQECKEYFDENNAADIFAHLQKSDAQRWHQKYKQSKQHKKYVQKRLNNIDYKHSKQSTDVEEASSQLIDFKQLKIFFERNIAIKSKDIRNTILLLAQAPIIAFLLTIGFERVNIPLLMVISLSAIFFGCVNSCREIVGELPIFRRELMLNLNIWSYLTGKIAMLAGFCCIQGLIFLPIIYLKIDMVGKPPLLMFFLFITTAFGGIFLGLFISAISNSQEKAMTCVPIALLPQIIFAGVLFKLKNISEYISYFTISRWSLKAFQEIDIMYNVSIIAFICAVLLFATYMALKRYDIKGSSDNDAIQKIRSYFK